MLLSHVALVQLTRHHLFRQDIKLVLVGKIGLSYMRMIAKAHAFHQNPLKMMDYLIGQ